MERVGIVTLITGYNYGSLLQAYASKEIIKYLGYDACLVWVKSGLVKGRDVRVKKLFKMGIRAIFEPKAFKNGVNGYISANKHNITSESKEKFTEFTNNYLEIKKFTYSKLKVLAHSNNYKAFVCGSDQIWNSMAIYVDPLYYLRFAPQKKRIAYAPSFGKNEIPNYNKKYIKKYISEIPYLSIREKQGQRMIYSLLGKTCPVLIDPTLLLSGGYWKKLNNLFKKKSYILFYFLNEPNESTKNFLKKVEQYLNKKIIVLPSKDSWHESFENIEEIDAGPLEFVSLIANADFICTDSFHGMAFSINLNKSFLAFKREYGNASDQSSRIVSLLNNLGLEKRYVRDLVFKKYYFDKINFNSVNAKLERERLNSFNYLKRAIESCKK